MRIRSDIKVLSPRLGWVLSVIFLCMGTVSADMLDLTSDGASGYLGGAYFVQIDSQSTGTGVIDPFVRVGSGDASQDTISTYNTTQNNVLDNGSADNWNHALQLSEVPLVEISGVFYREFLLDINQERGDSLLSLDEIQLFLSGTANQSVESFNSGILELADSDLVYRLDNGGDNSVLLDYMLNHGSGSGDMFMYVPDSYFANSSNDYVYLYSQFGLNYENNAGFEEWSVREPTGVVPEPTTMVLLGISIGAIAVRRAKRT